MSYIMRVFLKSGWLFSKEVKTSLQECENSFEELALEGADCAVVTVNGQIIAEYFL